MGDTRCSPHPSLISASLSFIDYSHARVLLAAEYLYLLAFLISFAVVPSMENSGFLLGSSCDTKLSSHAAQTVKEVWFTS